MSSFPAQFGAPNKPLKSFDRLVGEWDIDITDTEYWDHVVHGHVSIQPVESGGFLIWRSDYQQPGPPSSVSFIGSDESTPVASVLYFDVRGVSRVLHTSLEGDVWRVWREAPGFDQRMTGQLSSDGQSIHVSVEKSTDNSTWTHDFDIHYTRRNGNVY